MIRNKDLYERFVRYVKIDTQSQEDTGRSPSTEKQRDLASLLAQELAALGLETDYDETYCYVYAFLPGDPDAPALGFVAHMDTSPSVSDTNVQPRLIENYAGEDPLLKTDEFPELLKHLGEDLIATDGTTLLGADDKAGIAEIMSMLFYFVSHPEIPHRPVAVAFTPDEEIGEGPLHFDIGRFRTKEAYTMDGGRVGELEYECFNADAAKVLIEGLNVHPGTAKGQMINACTLAAAYIRSIPKEEVPEKTEGYEGYYHLDSMFGSVEQMTLKYILRDFTRDGLAARVQTLRDAAAALNADLDRPRVTVEVKEQYRNMYEVLQDHRELIENAREVMLRHGVTPVVQPIRGGTDGATISFMGVPCPNLGTGGFNYHSRFEFTSVQEMETSTEILIDLVRLG